MGKAIRAVSMNPNAARLMGINIDGVVSATFLVGGLMTGAAGFFYVLKYENTASNIGFELGIAAFTAAILGGIETLRAPSTAVSLWAFLKLMHHSSLEHNGRPLRSLLCSY